MTWRRWQYDGTRDEEVKPPLGPLETACAQELEALGFTPLTEPGPLRTAALRALSLAEGIDRSLNTATLPAMDRQLGTVMDEARRASKADESGLTGPEPGTGQESEISDFEAERKRRRGGGQAAN